MHLNIKNDEAHRLAAELARVTGKSMTSAVTEALRETLEREQRRQAGGKSVTEKLMEHARIAWEWPDTGVNPDDVIEYDEYGAPK